MEHHNIKTDFKDLIKSGHKIIWPIRLLSLSKSEELVLEVTEDQLIEELVENKKKDFEQFYHPYKSSAYRGIIIFVVLEEPKSKVRTPFAIPLSIASSFLKEIDKLDDYCEGIIGFYKHYLDEVIISKINEEKQLTELFQLVAENTGLLQESVKRKLQNDKFEIYNLEGNYPIDRKKIRFKLFNNLFDQRPKTSDVFVELLVVFFTKNKRLGYIFHHAENIKKVEKLFSDIVEKRITFTLKAELPNKNQILHIHSLVEGDLELGGFKLTKGNRNDEIIANYIQHPPFEQDVLIINKCKEQLLCIINLISYHENIGFIILGKPSLTNYVQGKLALTAGKVEVNHSIKPNTIDIVKKNINADLAPKVNKALDALNKSIVEINSGSSLKTIWAAVEDIFFNEKDRKPLFTKQEKKQIFGAIDSVVEKENSKIRNAIGCLKNKTKNHIIKENILTLIPDWGKERVDSAIDRAFKLRGQSVHSLIVKDEECYNAILPLKTILKKYISEHLTK